MCDSKCTNDNKCLSYEEIQKISKFLKERISIQPLIGIVCGTGLGNVTSLLQRSVVIDYKEIPKFPVSTVPGHSGQLCSGFIGPVPVICMKGRFHYFEGYALWQCTLPIRVMKLLGIETLILSNAAGAINTSYKIGDIMLIKDHLNLVAFSGHNPLRGPNDERWGPRFVAINEAYDKDYLKLARQASKELKMKNVQEGVYACIGGPSFETVAELKALKLLGADCVGMSTVHEVIAAQHCGIKCFAFSLLTNKCGMDYESEVRADHDEILTVGAQQQDQIKRFVEKFIQLLTEKL